jgi:hypothetical protein
MDYSIRREEGLLAVDMSGDPSIEDLRAMFAEMLRHGEFRRALLVMRTAHCLSLPDTMELIAALPKMGFPGDYRIALLFTDESMRQTSQFAENVAVNRGIGLHAFSERDKALSWLSLP